MRIIWAKKYSKANIWIFSIIDITHHNCEQHCLWIETNYMAFNVHRNHIAFIYLLFLISVDGIITWCQVSHPGETQIRILKRRKFPEHQFLSLIISFHLRESSFRVGSIQKWYVNKSAVDSLNDYGDRARINLAYGTVYYYLWPRTKMTTIV